VKALVAEEIRPGGTVVLNADDAAVAGLAGRPAVRGKDPDIRFFTLRPDSPLAVAHQRAGGLCYQVRDGEITETSGGEHRPVLPVAGLPGAFGGRAAHLVANALAAVAACRAAGVSIKDIRRALATFTPAEANPGRGNVYRAGDGPVLVDYGHNAAALHATGAMIADVWGGAAPAGPAWRARAGQGAPAGWRPAAVAAVTLPGDRRDDLLTETAEAIAAWFTAVVVYEDRDKRGRAPGEMQGLISAALRRARPDIACQPADGPEQALRAAVRLAAGAPVLFLYEKLADARAALDAIGATPWPDPAPGPAGPSAMPLWPAGLPGTSDASADYEPPEAAAPVPVSAPSTR
jgi:cyanophycin synthetase